MLNGDEDGVGGLIRMDHVDYGQLLKFRMFPL